MSYSYSVSIIIVEVPVRTEEGTEAILAEPGMKLNIGCIHSWKVYGIAVVRTDGMSDTSPCYLFYGQFNWLWCVYWCLQPATFQHGKRSRSLAIEISSMPAQYSNRINFFRPFSRYTPPAPPLYIFISFRFHSLRAVCRRHLCVDPRETRAPYFCRWGRSPPLNTR